MNSLKWIWQFMGHKKWAFAGGFFFIVLEIVVNLAETGLQKWLVDDVFIHNHFEKLPFFLVLLGIVYLGSSTLFTIVAMIHHSIGYSLRVSLAGKLMSAIQNIPIGIFQNERTARYVSYFNDVYDAGTNAYRIPLGFQEILRALALIIIIVVINPLILAFTLVIGCCYILLGKYFSARVKSMTKEILSKRSDLLIHIEEGISSTREVIAYHRMNWEMEIYNRLFKKYFDTVMQEGKLTNIQLFITGPLRWCSNFSVLIIGGYAAISGTLSIGSFLILYQYASQMIGSLQGVYDFVMRLSSATAGIERIKSVFENELKDKGDHRLQDKVKSIEFRNVCFKYSNEAPNVLNDFHIDIPIGKKVAIVGTSGGGKSTLSKLLVRFYDPSEGEILINGINLSDINKEDWMSKLCIAFQEPYMFPDTIQTNILFGRENIPETHMMDLCKRVFAHDFITDLEHGYDTLIGERGITLSGGQRQRISLARALLADPEILILDEATSALDLETERQIQKTLDEIRNGRTTIIIAHRLSTIQNADIIYVIDNGKVVESGTHEELIGKDSVYRQLSFSNG